MYVIGMGLGGVFPPIDWENFEIWGWNCGISLTFLCCLWYLLDGLTSQFVFCIGKFLQGLSNSIPLVFSSEHLQNNSTQGKWSWSALITGQMILVCSHHWANDLGLLSSQGKWSWSPSSLGKWFWSPSSLGKWSWSALITGQMILVCSRHRANDLGLLLLQGKFCRCQQVKG
jgi:hypothetical protein